MKTTHCFAYLLLLATLPIPAFALPDSDHLEPTEREIYVPKGWEGAYEFGYAPAVRVGDQVILSGIPNGGPGDYEERTRRMYQRAVELLEAAGATIEDVIELTTFHTESKDSAAFRKEFDLYMPIHREFFGEHRPAWTAVGTTVLLSPKATVEMRVVAIAGSGARSRVVSSRNSPSQKPSEAPVTPEAEKETP